MENDDAEEFVPRAYQVELLEIAREHNSIIYLPTGTGKTFIAVMLIKELSADIRRPYEEGGKHTIFIVNTVPLVAQQSEYIARLTGLSCGQLSGELGIDFWSKAEWDETLKEHQVLVMTAQILVNALCHGYMSLNRINLIIFDECHRAVNDHPMRQIMQQFEHCPEEAQPRTLGLSASLLNGNVKLPKIETTVKCLEITFHAKIITTRIALQDYHVAPKETIIQFDEYILCNTGQRIESIINNVNQYLKSLDLQDSLMYIESSEIFRPKSTSKKLISTVSYVSENMSSTGIYGANKAALSCLVKLECMKKCKTNEEIKLVVEYVITEVIKCRKLLQNEMQNANTEAEKIHSYSSDKIRKLFLLLKKCYNDSSDDHKFCCIIFVQQRSTVEVIFQILKSLSTHDEEYKFLKPDFMIGTSATATSIKDLCISKWNKDVMRRFRNGLSNCIVATDIIDEGIDIQQCSLVVRYNLPMDVRTYVQSKGRLRHSSSQYVLLLRKDDLSYLQRYNTFKQIEHYLQQLLIQKTNERCRPAETEIKDELYQHDIDPYIIAKDGKKYNLTEQSVISLINIYCASLFKSKFGHLAPVWVLHKIRGKAEDTLYQVSLKLPIVSPLRTMILGDPMKSVSLAKRSAAMKACIALHKIGELNDALLPQMEESLQQNLNYLFPNWIYDDTADEIEQIGTYKKKRHHQLKFPLALYAAFPLPQKTVYLHLLCVKPKYSAPHGDNRRLVFYNLLCNGAGFCILSSKRMPKIPSFPIFMSAGELSVTVKVNHTTLHLCKEEIGYIKTFHTLIFSEIVPIIKSFMVFDNNNLDNCFLIAPVDEKFNINWQVIKQCPYIERIQPPEKFDFKSNDYELALVIPNYRASADIYIVTQICDDITPNSCFPTDNFFSYVHYYKEKHGIAIRDLNQPLLEVKPISRKINYIVPRHVQSDLKKRKHSDLQEHLVPELCSKINFPALYWLKATILPSILHRISQLLIAEDLRDMIAREIKLTSLPDSNEWPPLLITDVEVEESFDAILEMSGTENIEMSVSEFSYNGPEIDVINIEPYHYPWQKDQEPADLYRNIEEVQLIQIEHYCQFMNEAYDSNNIMKCKKICFQNKPIVTAPSLQILTVKNPYGPDPVQIMYALTTKLGHDAFQLERLETLGDSYLKFITSLFLYETFPKYSEGALTMIKGKIIGNRNLYYCGVKKNIPGRMKVDDFVPLSNFIAPGYTVFRQLQTILLDAEVSPNILYEIQIPQNEQFSGYISESTKIIMQEKVLNWETAELQTGMEHYLGMQTVSDKSVADCVEALIGAYLNSMGIEDTITLLKWFQILPNETASELLLYSVTQHNSITLDRNIDYYMPWASDIETKIGYKFKNRQLLLQAFTHPSYTASSAIECYQRLEFLGDAILDFLITCYIYEYCGNLNPGALTDLRSALVNNITFACLSVKYGLHTALLSYAPELNRIIERFVKFQEERDYVINDELLWILLEEEECSMAEYVDVPKVLGDIYESVIGAIYLDSNKNLTVVWEMIYSFMHEEFAQFSKNIPKQPIRVLYEFQGAKPQFLKAIVLEHSNTIMVPLKVNIDGTEKYFHGFGSNKKLAKCAAAKQALKTLLCKV